MWLEFYECTKIKMLKLELLHLGKRYVILLACLFSQCLIGSSFISAFPTSKVVCEINVPFNHYFSNLKLVLPDSLSLVIMKMKERGQVVLFVQKQHGDWQGTLQGVKLS